MQLSENRWFNMVWRYFDKIRCEYFRQLSAKHLASKENQKFWKSVDLFLNIVPF